MNNREEAIVKFYRMIEEGEDTVSVCMLTNSVTPYQPVLRALQDDKQDYIYFERRANESMVINKKTNSMLRVKNTYYDCRGEKYSYIVLLNGVDDSYAEKVKKNCMFSKSWFMDLR